MRVLNILAAIANILAYLGLVLLAAYDTGLIHLIGAFMYFVLNSMYGLIHMYLLWNQTQYPRWCKIAFTILPFLSITFIIIWIYGYLETSDKEDFKEYLAGGEVYSTKNEFEWLSIVLSVILMGLMSYLFHVDSVDDELRDFFCLRQSRHQYSSGNKAP